MTNHKFSRIFLFLLIVSCTIWGLICCKGKVNIIGISDYYYEDSDKYVAGDALLEETVENIEINWMVENVTLMSHSSNTVSITEESEMELTEDIKLHYWLDNKTLRIKFCSSGKWDLSELKKKLTVLVPSTMIINNLKIDTLSADIKLSNCNVNQLVKVNTISGKLDAELSNYLNEFKGDSTSGSFKVSAGTISHFNVETVSGMVSLSAKKEPDFLDIDTTSGDIRLALPKDSSFTLDYDTTSGEISSDLSYNKESRKYIFKAGKGEYNIDTVSGDVLINQINNGE